MVKQSSDTAKSANVGNVKSAERVLKILEDFSVKQRPQRPAEIARSLSIPISSCFALLLTMVDCGILEYDRKERHYVPTKRLLSLSGWLACDNPLEHEAIRSARRLYREIGQPIAVTRRNGLLIEWLYTLRVTKLVPGQFRPLCHTVNGLAVLSRMTDHAVRELIVDHNIQFGKEYPIVADDILRKIESARSRGYVSGVTKLVPGLAAICFMLKDEQEDEEVLLSVQVCAAELSRREGRIVDTARRILPNMLC